MTESEFVASLSSAIANFQPHVEQRGDQHFLILPDCEPIPWRAPKKPRFLSRHNPNAIFYEESTTAAMLFLLARAKAPVMIDAGARLGYFATLALNYRPKPIDAYAFEIDPHGTEHFVRAAQEAASRGRHGELLLSGLSDEHLGQRDIWISVTKMFESEAEAAGYRDSAWVRLKMALRGKKDRDLPQRYSVLITSIDAFCSSRNLAPGLIKIDVDGYEAKVVPGALNTLRAHRPVVFLELHKRKFIERFNVTREEIVAPLFDMGYRALLLEDHRDRSRPVLPVKRGSPEIGREATDMFIFYHDHHING